MMADLTVQLYVCNVLFLFLPFGSSTKLWEYEKATENIFVEFLKWMRK